MRIGLTPLRPIFGAQENDPGRNPKNLPTVILGLNANEQRAQDLCYRQGQTPREAAKAMGLTLPQFNKLLKAADQKAKQYLEGLGVTFEDYLEAASRRQQKNS